MAVESWDDAMLWHGSLIGYMAGVKSACKDEDKSSLLIRMADTQAKLEFMESQNAKLRELCHDLRKEYAYLRARPRRFYVQHEARMAAIDARMRELGIEEDE